MKQGRKGISPRYPVLKPAFEFDRAMGVLLNHLRANNSMEIKTIRCAAKLAATTIFLHVKNRLVPADKDDTLEKKLQYNDSISWLRTRYVKTVNKISESDFGYDK